MKEKLGLIIKILSGNALAQIILILTTPILTRMYSIEDFGVLGIFNSILLTVGVIGCLRYDQLMFNYSGSKDWNDCYNKGIVISLVFSLVIFFFSISLYFIGLVHKLEYVIIAPCLILLFSLAQLFSSALSVSKKYTSISNSLVVRSISVFSFQLYLNFNPLGLVWGLLIGQVAQVSYLYWSLRRSSSVRFFFLSDYSLSKHAIMSTFQSLSNSFSSQLPSFFIPVKFGVESMGYYSMALRLTYLPITFFSNAIRPFILGELNRNRSDLSFVYKSMLKGSVFMLSLSILGIFLINIFAEEFFIIYAGEDWSFSGKISGILSFWILMAFSNVLSTAYLTVYSRFKELLIYDGFLLFFRLLIVVVFYVIDFELLFFLKVYALIGFLFNFSIIIYTVRLARNEYNVYCDYT